MPPLEEWSRVAAELLDGLGAQWVLAGALAAQQYRIDMRQTTDVDVLARSVVGLREACEARGYTVKERGASGDDDPYLYFVRGRAGGPDIKIDVIVAETPYQEEAIDRGLARHVLTVEDVIIHKLLAWRARDQDDIRSILAAGHEPDETYVAYWATEWGVEDRWHEAQTWR